MCLTMHRHDQQLRHRASGKSVSASRAGCDARATHLLGLYSRLFTSCPSSSLRSDIKDTNRMLAHGRPPTRKTCSLPRAHVNRRARSAGRRMGWVSKDRAGGGGRGRGSYQHTRRPTNWSVQRLHDPCKRMGSRKRINRVGCPGVLFARGGDAGCARGRGGPLVGGEALACPVAKLTRRHQSVGSI